jgi:hypothetical protein
MPNIAWKLEASVADGPSESVARSVEVEAYDKAAVELADGAPETTIEIGTATADVLFVLVTASDYGAGLTYKVNDTGNPSHVLDGPLHLAGSGAIGLLGFAPTSLLFTNALGSAVTVEILVGRDAIPSP